MLIFLFCLSAALAGCAYALMYGRTLLRIVSVWPVVIVLSATFGLPLLVPHALANTAALWLDIVGACFGLGLFQAAQSARFQAVSSDSPQTAPAGDGTATMSPEALFAQWRR
jgi:hypothetical protein